MTEPDLILKSNSTGCSAYLNNNYANEKEYWLTIETLDVTQVLKTDGYKHSIITFNNLVLQMLLIFLFRFLPWNFRNLKYTSQEKSPYLSIPVFSLAAHKQFLLG